MNLSDLKKLPDEFKVGFAIAIGEKVFIQISKNDERYSEGRAALDTCWKWIENNDILGDNLYKIIDNVECTGISEFAEDEEDINVAKIWYLLVDIVAYTAWVEYKREKVKYLPQALEGIGDDSLQVLMESAVDTSFISEKEIQMIQYKLLSDCDLKEKSNIKRNDFLSIVSMNSEIDIE